QATDLEVGVHGDLARSSQPNPRPLEFLEARQFDVHRVDADGDVRQDVKAGRIGDGVSLRAGRFVRDRHCGAREGALLGVANESGDLTRVRLSGGRNGTGGEKDQQREVTHCELLSAVVRRYCMSAAMTFEATLAHPDVTARSSPAARTAARLQSLDVFRGATM